MKSDIADVNLQKLYEALEAALRNAGVADKISVATSLRAFVDTVDELAVERGQLLAALEHATTDSVTGLLRSDQWRQQLAMALRQALGEAAIVPILDGMFPLAAARMVGLKDVVRSVVLATFDVRALDYTNALLGYAAGSEMLTLCAQTAATVLDEFLSSYGMQRRTSVRDPLWLCSLTRTGGDEFRAVLVGQAATRWRDVRDGLFMRLSEEEVPGLDIPPAMASGAMSMHVLLWYVGAFYRWRGLSLPTDREEIITLAIQLWCAFTEARADAQRVVEYGLLFADAWDDDPVKRERFDRWMSTKLMASAFNGRTLDEVHNLCRSASMCLKADDTKGAKAVFVHDHDDRMRVHFNILLAKARALQEENIRLRLEIFVISNEFEFPIP
ncbi:hypothetical protein COV06_00200 [Candidatus Uhrbacteria bacterium CG10_big_fil_rev_8_21_14_0_10_50_16]|uniref:GGDEF domain-containing protein n=1 Tax=Candidatus Uhrbacteria bacterium CG10_big_fil_rev_8_21_14_0_10_50_16 TaxID=1975039 RepID=A0A2H0RMT4_9BACT|nr:MAG: hypothetical protein COV06_00200 [Candidatus Uhrbacteria bacterium CG10_big_fil_rev_8_21_14_0_10_50_16]